MLIAESFKDGEVPEWPKGTGCKPVGSAYGGSNPPLSTMGLITERQEVGSLKNRQRKMKSFQLVTSLFLFLTLQYNAGVAQW